MGVFPVQIHNTWTLDSRFAHYSHYNRTRDRFGRLGDPAGMPGVSSRVPRSRGVSVPSSPGVWRPPSHSRSCTSLRSTYFPRPAGRNSQYQRPPRLGAFVTSLPDTRLVQRTLSIVNTSMNGLMRNRPNITLGVLQHRNVVTVPHLVNGRQISCQPPTSTAALGTRLPPRAPST